MNIKPIHTAKDYEEALAKIEELMNVAGLDTSEEDTLDILATLVENYEAEWHPISPPDPIGALEHYLDRKGLQRKDLMPHIGSIGRVHEIMNRRRHLTLAMMRKLSPATGIPMSTLAQECHRPHG